MFSTEWIAYTFLKIYEADIFKKDGSYNLENLQELIQIHGIDEPEVVYVD